MSQGPETTFINSVHAHLPKHLYRMKNHNQYNGGIADCWYSGDKRDLWVEYKYYVVPKRESSLISLVDGRSPPLSKLQQQWIAQRSAEGRNVWLIIGSKDGGVILERPWPRWNEPMTAKQFVSYLQPRKVIAERITSFCYEL